nr:MAG TPA: hypothetical protein [Bacteriophage sp.]
MAIIQTIVVIKKTIAKNFITISIIKELVFRLTLQFLHVISC